MGYLLRMSDELHDWLTDLQGADRPAATDVRTLAGYIEALGGRLEISAEFPATASCSAA